MGFVAALTALAVVRILGIPLGWWRALLAGRTGTVSAGPTAASLSESGHGAQVLVAMVGAALAGGLLSAAVVERGSTGRSQPSGSRLGRELYLALSDCGGAFVKLGQLLSARPTSLLRASPSS